MSKPKIGIIGGSGLYEIEGLTDARETRVDTPFGDPSDAYIEATLEGRDVVFLPRHGRGHRLMPTELNFRANIYGMKKLGVEWIISATAVGSLREDIEPLHIVVPDQFFDRTRNRVSTFFGDGLVAHVSFADPVCAGLGDIIYDCALEARATVHRGGTYLCMEGPQFSTRAESSVYRSWGMDIIGMTNLQEAKLAREAEMCYATMALVTDYDCWHQTEDDVDVEAIIATLLKNVETAKKIIKLAVPKIPQEQTCPCASALATAIITNRDAIPEAAKQRLGLIAGKYLS